ncbi:MAG: hypothetical protein ACOYXC_09485 [Candidatus Rifleibacteriota bacterium]
MNGKINSNKNLIVLLATFLVVFFMVDGAIAKKKPPKVKKPKPSELEKNQVYQDIPLKTFSAIAPDNAYILSGWICPGSGSARLALVTYKGGGKIEDSAGVEIASTSDLTLLGFANDVGIANARGFNHPGYPGAGFRYFRVFARFNFTSVPSIKAARIILQNTSNETASCSVWFDGIKLEKALKPDQEYPTSYHSIGNLLSSEFVDTLEGGPQYYEW